MKKVLASLVLVLSVFGLWACQSQEAADFDQSLTQTITSGEIKGQKDEDNQVLEWLGIPYAQAPVGDLRWKEPQDPEKWEDTFDATKAGDAFIQFSNNEVIGSEEALNLDVVRPDSTDKDLPVIVYIHGGNNQSGHAQEIKGNTFVNDIDAVYVSVNYRLGALGFNPLEALKNGSDLENSGNYSLLDMAKALDWVKENIEVFGGDKDNITLAGFSAGGRDVMATLISPLFEGKYDKAISFSGGMTLADPADSQEIFAQALAPLVVEDKVKEDEVAAKDWLLTSDQEVTDYLYGLSAERLAPLMGNAAIRMQVFPHLYKDGTVIPEEGFETSAYNDVPLMLVTGTNEFSLFTAFDPYFAEDFGSGELFKDEEKVAAFNYAKTYGGHFYRMANGSDSTAVMAEAAYQSPIYLGEISYGDDSAVTPDLSQTFGAFHGVFEPLLQKPSNYEALIGDAFASKGAQELSADFKAYLKNFLQSGDPNGDDLTKWVNWTSKDKAILSLSADKDQAVITESTDQETAAEVIADMEADDSLPVATKKTLNETVLNGRWFSGPLDDSDFNYGQ